MGLWDRIRRRQNLPVRPKDGWLFEATRLLDKREHAQAESLLRGAWEWYRTAPYPSQESISGCLLLLSAALEGNGKVGTDEFREIIEELIEIDGTLDGHESSQTIPHLRRLVDHHRARGDLERAHDVARRVLELAEASRGVAHPDLVQDLIVLVKVHVERGRPADALSVCRRTFGILEQAYGPQSNELAMNLAVLSLSLKDVPGADREKLMGWYARAVEILAAKPRDEWPAELLERMKP